MASNRKSDYVYFERKVRGEDEIQNLLFRDEDDNYDDDDDKEEEKDEQEDVHSSGHWVVEKPGNAKRHPTTPRQMKSEPAKHPSSRNHSENVLVSPLKIKRKLSYSVNKVETPSKKRPDIVSPILIKRVAEPLLTDNSVSTACNGKLPTIDLISSDDEDTIKTSNKKKKRNDVLNGRISSTKKSLFRDVTRTPKSKIVNRDDGSSDDEELVLPLSTRRTKRNIEKDVTKIASSDENRNGCTPSGKTKQKTEKENKKLPNDSIRSALKNIAESSAQRILLALEKLSDASSPRKTPSKSGGLRSSAALTIADKTPVKGVTPAKERVLSTKMTPAKGATPSKSVTPVKPSQAQMEPRVSSRKRNPVKRMDELLETPAKTAVTPRRSTRVSSMSPSTPSLTLRQKVLLANTPRSSLPPVKDEDESDEDFEITPRKSARSAKKKLDMTPSTPSSTRKVGHGFLSPVVADREGGAPSTPSSALGIARSQLQVSTLPTSLPCRDKEFNDIKSFISRKIQDRIGGCMYISGVPGTGKTATVHTVVKTLQKLAEDKQLPAFDFAEVNGLRMTEPRQAYVRIWQILGKSKVTPDQALKHLETKFLGKPKMCTVLLVDELDYLCNRRQDVIYNILDWTTKQYSKLIVITIANTMDLPERTLKGKVTSRMGLTRLVFQPYTYQQLEEIVLNRLDGCKAFHADAVQLVARKVAAVSGDARRALDICRRSTEILELEGRSTVSVLDIQKVLTQIFAGSRVQAIKNCSVMAKLVLRAIRDEVLRTGIEESTVALILPQLVSICALEGKRELTVTETLSIITNLADSGLIFAEKARKDINRKISLNVSTDDIHYAIDC